MGSEPHLFFRQCWEMYNMIFLALRLELALKPGVGSVR